MSSKKIAGPAKKSPSRSVTKAVREQAVTGPFVTDDPRGAWAHFRDEALKADPAALAVCKADPDIVRVNVARGVASVAPLAGKARVELPAVNVTRALESAALSLALTHACDRVDGRPASSAPSEEDDPDATLSLVERTSKMFFDRQLLVTMLKVFVGLGDFGQDSFAAILEGTGPIDGARDVLNADAALDGEKLRGRHPFTPAWRQQATRRARRLLADLSPDNAVRELAARNAASMERDAFWALLGAAHADLRKIGMVLFGEKELDAKVPPLMARSTRAATKAKTDGGNEGEGGGTPA
jgi:hypothetical protein